MQIPDREVRLAVMDSAAVGILTSDLDGVLTYANPALLRGWGYEASSEVLGRHVAEFCEDRDRVFEALQVLHDVGDTWMGELHGKKKDGTVFPIQVHASVVGNEDGSVVGLTATVIDVTERRRLEVELKGSREELERRAEERTARLATVERELESQLSFREAIIARAAEGLCACYAIDDFPFVQFTIWNDRMTAITGYTMEEINRLGWYQSLYPDADARERAIARMNRMREGNDLVEEEWTITRKDGEECVVSISTRIVEEGGQAHVLALIHDTTKRIRAEQALLAANRSLDRQVAHLQLVYDLSRVNADFQDLGKMAQEVARILHRGLAADLVLLYVRDGDDLNLLGMSTDLEEFSIDDAETHKVGSCLCGLAASERTAQYATDIRSDSRCTLAECKEAGICSIAALPLAASDEIIGVLGVAFVASREIREDSDILQAVSNEVAVGVRSAMHREELSQRRLAAMRSDRLRALGEMAAGIAHELNQPLVGVRGFAEHLLLGMERGWAMDGERTRRKLQGIVDQADRMTHIIQHVRSFSNQGNGPETLHVDVNKVALSALELLGAQLRTRGIDIEQKLDLSVPRVVANPFSLEEVVLNCLTNARDAIEARVVATAPEARTDSVSLVTRVTGRGSDKRVVLEIGDTGNGISPNDIATVFEPFFTTKGQDKGTGLGLSISRSIVEGFGGTMGIRSDVTAGTTVTIALPVAVWGGTDD